MRYVFLFTLFLLVADSGCAQSFRAHAGCYDVHVQGWNRTSPRGIDSVLFEPPSRVILTTDSIRRYPAGHAVRVAPGALPSPHRYAAWMLRDTSLTVTWSTGFVGLSAHLVRTESAWTGRARSFGDVMPWPIERREMSLVQVSCDEPTDPPASSDHLL